MHNVPKQLSGLPNSALVEGDMVLFFASSDRGKSRNRLPLLRPAA